MAVSAIVAILLGTANAAQAEGNRVVVIPISGQPAEAGARLTSLLVAAGNRTGSETTAAQAQPLDVLALAGCTEPSPTCWEQVRVTLGVDAIILGQVIPRSEPPGSTVEITIYREGGEPATRSYELEATEAAGIAAEFEPMASTVFTGEEAPQREPTPPPPPDPMVRNRGALDFDAGRVKRHAWIIAGAGTGAAILGGVFLVVASGKQDDVDNAPTDTVEDLERLEDLEQSGERFTLIGNAFLIAGSLAAITGGVLIAIQGVERQPAATEQVSVGPLWTDQGVVGISLGGRF